MRKTKMTKREIKVELKRLIDLLDKDAIEFADELNEEWSKDSTVTSHIFQPEDTYPYRVGYVRNGIDYIYRNM